MTLSHVMGGRPLLVCQTTFPFLLDSGRVTRLPCLTFGCHCMSRSRQWKLELLLSAQRNTLHWAPPLFHLPPPVCRAHQGNLGPQDVRAARWKESGSLEGHMDGHILETHRKRLFKQEKNLYFAKPLRFLDCWLQCCSIRINHICPFFYSGQFSFFFSADQYHLEFFYKIILAVNRTFSLLLHFLFVCCWFKKLLIFVG